MLAGVALDLARQHRPDLILLDLRLPDMPGEDVKHQLRTDPATRNIPIVILSAYASKKHIDQLLATGATAYLTKPIRVRDLLQTLDAILGDAVPDAGRPCPTRRRPCPRRRVQPRRPMPWLVIAVRQRRPARAARLTAAGGHARRHKRTLNPLSPTSASRTYSQA